MLNPFPTRNRRAASRSPEPVPGHAGRARTPGLRGRWSIAALALLLIIQPAMGQDDPVAEARPGAVTEAMLEAKIAEVEAATSIEETARAALVERYRKALSNLHRAGANAQAADDYRQAARSAPALIQAIRQQTDEVAARAPEDSLAVDPSLPLSQVEQLLQKEKADLAAVDARRADFEQRLAEEAGRPALIRQRLRLGQQALALLDRHPRTAVRGLRRQHRVRDRLRKRAPGQDPIHRHDAQAQARLPMVTDQDGPRRPSLQQGIQHAQSVSDA
jgi:hypothetical protein